MSRGPEGILVRKNSNALFESGRLITIPSNVSSCSLQTTAIRRSEAVLILALTSSSGRADRNGGRRHRADTNTLGRCEGCCRAAKTTDRRVFGNTRGASWVESWLLMHQSYYIRLPFPFPLVVGIRRMTIDSLFHVVLHDRQSVPKKFVGLCTCSATIHERYHG
jgi:hypothetical protein